MITALITTAILLTATPQEAVQAPQLREDNIKEVIAAQDALDNSLKKTVKL